MDEPGNSKLCLFIAVLVPVNVRKDKRNRRDPQGPGEFYCCGDRKRLGPIGLSGPDNRARIVYGYRRPYSELVLRKAESVANDRKEKQGDRI